MEGLSNEGIMVSSISACHSRRESYSHVVMALGKGEELSHNTIRISLDSSNTIEEAKAFIECLDKIVREVKQ